MRVSERVVTFVYDYGQVYVYDSRRQWRAESPEYLEALDDARNRGLSVGVNDGLIDLLMPRQDNFGAQLSVECCDVSPELDHEEWDHVVEFPLLLPTGALTLEASGGSGEVEIRLQPGTFRARWSGRNFAAAGEWGYSDGETRNPPDEHRLQIWPDVREQPPTDIKTWPACRGRA